MTKADLREHKTEKASDFKTFEVSIDSKQNQSFGDHLEETFDSVKRSLIKWMISLSIAQTIILTALIITINPFGH